MTDRLFTSKELLAAYKKKSIRTLVNWMNRDDSRNPLPKPINSGAGRGNQYIWKGSQLNEWELQEYGVVIEK